MSYEVNGDDWRLVVADNGSGKVFEPARTGGGLGTAIVQALVNQLGAKIEMESGEGGTSVSITRATFTSLLPEAA
ncbi:hypothetical protein D3C87_1936990 [compost metagenome]